MACPDPEVNGCYHSDPEWINAHRNGNCDRQYAVIEVK